MQANEVNSTRSVVNLNGDWQRYVNDKLTGAVRVPCSLRPGGTYTLRREFILPRLSQQRAIVRFNAINYFGQVSINGKKLGTTIPYVPQEFDLTQHAQEGRNTVEVLIVDAGRGPNGLGKDEVAFGTTGGWEAYGGIIRDAWVEIRPVSFIENVRFGYRLQDGLSRAACSAQLFVSSTESGSAECELSLRYGNSEVAHAKAPGQLGAGANPAAELSFDVNDLALWSPADPNLYTLHVALKSSTAEDHWSSTTGFRELKIQGRDFLLNGERLVLNGVCRHDMWEDQGFTLTPAQQEKDMRMIKALGCNYIRLVHYPHDRRIIDLAEKFGILVSEEPGYWGMDFNAMQRPFIDLGLRVLETTIRRDWNSPAVFAWLLGNECDFTVAYLKEAKALCNKLDPIARPVSVAHINGDIPKAKKKFDDSNLDFYDWHAYEFMDDKFVKFPEQFGSAKPLTFTEWGWEDGGHGDLFWELDFDSLLTQTEQGNVAGHSFWSWNDMRQYTRRDWATDDGILRSGAVTEDRTIREPLYSRLATLFAGRRALPPYDAPDHPQALPLKWSPFLPGSTREAVDLQKLVEGQSAAWVSWEAMMEKYWAASISPDQWPRTGGHFRLWRTPSLEIAGASFRSAVIDGYVRPLILTSDAPEVTIPIGRSCSTLHFLGQASFPQGYPVRGQAGDTAAVFSIFAPHGPAQDLAVRNGMELAQSNCIYDATRIDPIAQEAQPALEFTKDIVREQYRFFLWSVPVKAGRVQSIRCRLNRDQPSLAILAITTES